MIPLYKAGSKKDVNNYRPISLLHTISKIIEKIVNEQITAYFNDNSLFTEFQFGFRKKRSTSDVNNLLLQYVYDKLNKKSNVIITFLDLKKAFDTVNTSILLRKIQHYETA